MTKKANQCEMCGKPLHFLSKGNLCSPACRKAKSRLKLDAGKNAIDARNAIRRLILALDLGIVGSGDIADEYYDISSLLSSLYTAYDNAWNREHGVKPTLKPSDYDERGDDDVIDTDWHNSKVN